MVGNKVKISPSLKVDIYQKFVSQNFYGIYLFLRGAVNPRASTVINLAMGSPTPRGQKFSLPLQSTR